MKQKKIYIFILFLICILFIILGIVKSSVQIKVNKFVSQTDYDNDGIVDSEEFIYRARQEAENKVEYTDEYYQGGYPPSDKGVCTDVVWRAFMQAGYVLRDMVNEDIKENREDYPWIENIDKNIDFRRVRNLEVFFDRNAEILTTEIIPGDIENLEKWQGGDIVIFGKYNHIAIISDKRNYMGVPYIIHNAGPVAKEENTLILWRDFQGGITKHYRFSK